MKVIAIYTKTVEVWVELGEFDTWEDGAKAAKARPAPPIPADQELSLDQIWEQKDPDDELHYGHQIVGLCNKCGTAVVEGCNEFACDGKTNHAPDKGGWVSTEHGHQIWCSQTCRTNDPEDYERPENRE